VRAALSLILLLTSLCAAADLAGRIQAIMDTTPEARQSFWGIRVFDTDSGAPLFALNAEKFFVPASNTKLVTTALAFHRLGPEYRFITRVEANVLPDAAGRVRELRLIGGGDPNLSARVLPYDKDKTGPNPLAAIEALADAVTARGVRLVDGDIVGDDTAYEWEPYPDGWAVDDPVWEYGAPVSALTLNDNAFTLTTAPAGRAGEPGVLSLHPAVEYFTIHNQTRTVAKDPRRIVVERLPGSRELTVRGDVLLTGRTRVDLLAVDDPALFAAAALRDALLKRGVRVTGGIRAEHRRAGEPAPAWAGVEIARHRSAPLADALQVINKVSQNLHTEMVLREVARRKTGFGTREAGLAEMEAFVKELGVPEGQFRFEDASGLSRLTLLTPETVNAVLLSMYRSPHRDLWIATLPVAGVDGTLANRFARAPEASRIRAKTGSISHVSALSGYALRRDGRTLGFTIMANNYNASHAPVRKAIDAIALALLE
jgi:serine-type D-Ala-D-Ala carboxypeptidase/endopeptidase (penicillin-binding protein 4)